MKIKVYAADAGQLEDTNLFDHFYRLVSAARREKVDRMRFYPDKCLSLGAGALLEAALAAEGLSDLTMTTEAYQKPCLAHRPDIHFNISHSGTKVMCAVSGSDIGCDVEQVKDFNLQIARRFFYAEEYETIMRCRDEDDRAGLFFRYWTLKESFMKATGLGFSLPLDQFCIILDSAGISVRQNVDQRAWYFREFDLHDGYKYAVCSADMPVHEVRLTEVFFDSLAGICP